MDLVNRLLFRKIGVDQAILFTGLARIVQAIGGLVVVVLVTKKLTNIEQGYYFTFASILAIQIFFELGFNNILSQYVAHEAINIRLDVAHQNLGFRLYCIFLLRYILLYLFVCFLCYL